MSVSQFDAGQTPPRECHAVTSPSSGKTTVVSSEFSPSWVRYRTSACPRSWLLVQGGQFTYRWSNLTDVPGSIGPDGSVSGQAGAIALSGHLNGDELQGDLTNGACALHFTTYRRFSAT